MCVLNFLGECILQRVSNPPVKFGVEKIFLKNWSLLTLPLSHDLDIEPAPMKEVYPGLVRSCHSILHGLLATLCPQGSPCHACTARISPAVMQHLNAVECLAVARHAVLSRHTFISKPCRQRDVETCSHRAAARRSALRVGKNMMYVAH